MTDRISIISRFKRSALSVEERSDLQNFKGKYLPTKQAESFVGQVAAAVRHGGGAHALSGAYGAGKSSLVIFAMHQMCCRTKNFTPDPFKLRDKEAERHCLEVHKNGGMLGISVVGASVPLGRRIVDGAKLALSDYAGTPPASLRKIASMKSAAPDSGKILLLLGTLSDELRRHKKAGILLIIDEFGRHMERMVALQDSSDMHLLQGLAEMAGARKSPISLVVILHHGMEHYSRRLISFHREEWEKTRGRFAETWLENTERDVADIAASMFKCRDNPNKKTEAFAAKWVKNAKIFQRTGSDFAPVTQQCWPLHPVTVVALARLSTYLGQNDRTVSGWMTTDSDAGFKHAAERTDEWVYPSALYRHFFGNPQNIPANPLWARRISDICAAEERFNGDKNAMMLMQTIAVLNCIGGGIASEETLQICLPQGFPMNDALSHLLQQSLIIYRKHREEYCVWQGSDYDILGAVTEATGKNEKFSLADELARTGVLTEIVAHRHLVETGNFRTFPVQFVDAGKAPCLVKQKGSPQALVFLVDDADGNDFAKYAGKYDIYGEMPVSKLAAMGREVAVLRMLLSADYRLQEDAVARKEVERQMEFVEQKIADIVFDEIYLNMQWMHDGKEWDDVQSAASAAMSNAYHKGFNLYNEIINRDRAGGSITSVLRALCSAMVESAEKQDLGIKKHPPHLLVYRGFLQAKGMHVEYEHGFRLVFDSGKVSKDLRPAVCEIEKAWLSGNGGEPCGVQEVMDRLASRPYGIKRAPALILCLVCLLCHKDRLALYEKGEYVHNWGQTTLERLMGAPSHFSIAVVLPIQADDTLLAGYYKAVSGKESAEATVVSVARALLLRYSKIDSYGLHSDSVSEGAQNLRRAILNAKSPSDLLFNDLPLALSGGDFLENKKTRRKYFERVTKTLTELSCATGDLLSRLGSIICYYYGCKDLRNARARASKDARMVLSEGRMYPIHKHFVHSLQDNSQEVKDNMTWLKHVTMSGLLAKKLPEHWTDADEAAAEFALRRNLLWLQNASMLLRKCGDGDFFITTDMGSIASAVEQHEVDSIIEVLKGHFSPEELPQAMSQINYILYKESV